MGAAKLAYQLTAGERLACGEAAPAARAGFLGREARSGKPAARYARRALAGIHVDSYGTAAAGVVELTGFVSRRRRRGGPRT